jgi:hypothetical protein
MHCARRNKHVGALRRVRGAIRNSLSMLYIVRSNWAALCAARVGVRTAVDVAIGGKRGVSDPLCHPPFFAPWSRWRGSLTLLIDVSFVRTNSACLLQLWSAPHDSAATQGGVSTTLHSP